MAGNVSTLVVFFLATLALLAAAMAVEVFYVRRRRLTREIAAFVGSHVQATRAVPEGTPMPHDMLEAVVNQHLSTDNEAEAFAGMQSMLATLNEARRRNFLMPLTPSSKLGVVVEWSKRGGRAGELALKILPHLVERHVQHMDQLMAQSFERISDADADAAVATMRAIAHTAQVALNAGLGVDPRMVLNADNKRAADAWASQAAHAGAKDAAEALLFAAAGRS